MPLYQNASRGDRRRDHVGIRRARRHHEKRAARNAGNLRNPFQKLRNILSECQVSVSPNCAVRRNDRGSSRGLRRALRTVLLALPRESAKSRSVALMIASELVKEIVKRDSNHSLPG